MRRSTLIVIGLGLVALALIVAIAPVLAGNGRGRSGRTQIIQIDVAEEFTRFVFDPDMVNEEGWPIHGNPFITQGYIYPAGTLAGGDGINPDGSPEFPDKVIGKWICRGWVIGDTLGADGTPAAITTQFFQFGEGYGNQVIISEGYEFMQPGQAWSRTITGGSGDYEGVYGEQVQEILGISEFMGISFRMELRLER